MLCGGVGSVGEKAVRGDEAVHGGHVDNSSPPFSTAPVSDETCKRMSHQKTMEDILLLHHDGQFLLLAPVYTPEIDIQHPVNLLILGLVR